MKYESPYKEIPKECLGENHVFQDVLDAVVKTTGTDRLVKSNGIDAGGWEILTALRQRLEGDLSGFGMVFTVVTTKKVRARLLGVKPPQMIDFMQKRGDKIFFWWEFGKMKGTVTRERIGVEGFEAVFVDLDTKIEFFAIIGLGKESHSSIEKSLRSADVIEMSGMWVETSTDVKERKTFMVVNGFEVIEEDFSGADGVLGALKDWRQLVPSRDVSTGELLFSEDTFLAMLMGAMFYRKGSAALNIIFFGPPNTGKTASLKFLCENMLGGSFEGATASGGKGWLVTHKEGVESKIFKERRVMFVDEFFKATGSMSARSNFHSYALELNVFLEKHMQVLEKTDMEASSGVGVVKGVMKCSFLGSENNSEQLQKALAKASTFSDGPLRRLQFGYVDSVVGKEKFQVKQSRKLVERKMEEYFSSQFGPGAMKGIENLFVHARRMTDDDKINAPDWWKKAMMLSLWKQVEVGAECIPREFVPGIGDEDLVEKVEEYIRQHQEAMNSCWVCSGIIRGWEVYGNLNDLRPVFDLKAMLMARDAAKYMFVSKLRVLAPGIRESMRSSPVVRRM